MPNLNFFNLSLECFSYQGEWLRFQGSFIQSVRDLMNYKQEKTQKYAGIEKKTKLWICSLWEAVILNTALGEASV